jgi:glycosyltransferase involved in cell wall biosynthesis
MEFRRVFQIPVSRMRHVDGSAWAVDDLPMPYGADGLHPAGTELALFEDGTRLRPAHGRHAEIARDGGGRYSHWLRSLVFASSDGCPPDASGRTYTAVYESPLDDAEEERLRALCDRIRLHRPWSVDDLRTLARLREPGQRAYVFEWLGRSFIGARDPAQAVEQFVRAWALGREPALGYLVDHMPGQGRTAELWSILHRALIGARRRNDPLMLCEAVVQHHRAVYAAYEAGVPSPGFQDPVLVDAAMAVLGPLAPVPSARSADRLRVGYLLAGEGGERYSPLPDISIDLALAHDRSRVEPVVLTFHSLDALARESPFFAGRRDRLAGARVPLLALPREGAPFDAVKAAAETVAALDLDVLVTNALSDYAFLLATLRPARRLVGLGLGEIQLYTSPVLDSCVQFTLKPGEDGLCDTVLVRGFVSEPRMAEPGTVTPAELRLPPGGPTLLSAGRAVKFRSRPYWDLVARVLAARPAVRLVVCGIDRTFLEEQPAAEPVRPFADRVHPLGWRNDYLRVAAACDLVLDTFPQGGGWTLFEPMSLGIPVIGYRDPPLPMFREATWNPGLEFFDLPEAVFDWWEPDSVVARVLDLIDDPATRRAAGAAGRAALPAHRDVQRVAADLEAEFRRLLEG